MDLSFFDYIKGPFRYSLPLHLGRDQLYFLQFTCGVEQVIHSTVVYTPDVLVPVSWVSPDLTCTLTWCLFSLAKNAYEYIDETSRRREPQEFIFPVKKWQLHATAVEELYRSLVVSRFMGRMAGYSSDTR